MSKILRRIFLTAVTVIVIAAAAICSACSETRHPRAKITFSFNSAEYTVEYTLYRNMYPQTVRHFIELADAGFYNDMIIHDYASNDWYTGGYSYTDGYSQAYSNGSSEYFEEVSKESEYYSLFDAGKLTATVFATEDRTQTVPTLVGEFKNNGHEVENNPVTSAFGVLKMYYYSKGESNVGVFAEYYDGVTRYGDYKYNAATSIFAIQTGGSSSLNDDNYCAFARLRNDKARDNLQDLLDAVSEYSSSLESGTSFSKTISRIHVDSYDKTAPDDGRNMERSFTATVSPITVRSVKITKY